MIDLLYQFLFVVVLLCTFIYMYFNFAYLYWKNRGFPYLEPKFPWGNKEKIWELSRTFTLQTMNYYEKIKEKSWKFAGIYTIIRPVLVILDPDYIKDILAQDFNHFVDRGFFYNEKAEPTSAHLFALDGNDWRYMRTKMSPTFTSGKMKMMFSSIVKHSETLVEALNKCATGNKDIDIKDFLANFTTDVIGSCAFGLEMNSFDSNEAEFRKYGKLMFIPENKFQILKLNILSNMPQLGKALGLVVRRKYIETFFCNLVKRTVKYREENQLFRPDFLQLLINLKNENSLSMDQIIPQVFLFFIAGFDTSSSAMTFALYELARHRELQERVRKEINEVLEKYDGVITYENINEMTYLQQVLDETLRLYPSVPNLQRVCIKDYKLRDTNLVVEKGTPIVIPIISLHRDAEYYPNPLKFDPDRFMKENKSQRHKFVHLPFGEGPRNCIGLRFGVMESKIGLIQILRNFKLSISSSTKMPLTLRKGVFLLATEEILYLNAEKL